MRGIASEHGARRGGLYAKLPLGRIDEQAPDPLQPVGVAGLGGPPVRRQKFGVVEPDADRRWREAVPIEIGLHALVLLRRVAPIVHAVAEVARRHPAGPGLDQGFGALDVGEIFRHGHPVQVRVMMGVVGDMMSGFDPMIESTEEVGPPFGRTGGRESIGPADLVAFHGVGHRLRDAEMRVARRQRHVRPQQQVVHADGKPDRSIG